MKLFRRHTAEFQRQIESSDSFVQDTSRKYNRDGEKNAACFYFYACTEDGAGNYRQYNAYGDEIDTELHTYEADAKLLDLRREADRAKCTALLAYLHAEQIDSTKKMLRSYTSELKSSENIKKARERRATIDVLKRFIHEAGTFIANYSIEDVIADKRFDGLSLWGQTASDYGAGVALKSDLQRLGYDGVIYEDFDSVEVALIVPAVIIKKAMSAMS